MKRKSEQGKEMGGGSGRIKRKGSRCDAKETTTGEVNMRNECENKD